MPQAKRKCLVEDQTSQITAELAAVMRLFITPQRHVGERKRAGRRKEGSAPLRR